MAFISLIFMGICLVFTVIGIIELLIALIIFLTRFIKKKRNATVGKASKITAIVFLVLGGLSVMPAVFLCINYGFAQVNEAKEYYRLANKYQVGTEELQDEFVYQGDTLVYVEELEDETRFGDPELTLEANLIFKNSDKNHQYLEMDKIESESPYEIYRICRNSKTYVKKEERERVIDFYLNQAHYYAGIVCKHSNIIEEHYDISRKKIEESIRKDKKEVVDSSDVADTYCFEVISKDEVCSVEYEFILLQDGNILYKLEKKGKKIEAYLLSDEGMAYINKRIKQFE